ncbi:helix-turn-helix domain containing protein [Streptomyces sp. ID03-2B]|uniref:TetR/AcrR family transcriptional regulator n=1 Tax=Streptomyces caviscabies TaxID=90079 RepID=A0ABW2MM44_9ACTN|nr:MULTISPECIES: helix-turn-helix domain-containing protein [Streptomyces]MDX2669671.1 helix-turn-helix domain containing protein [Streptomyces sp. NRRL_ISP-5395]MDX3343575.1 helix-turn-helix domain containing protein [Streptomyces sp. ME02-6979.5a]MDX3507204.1 helix-turn-helix domain containing protein [Streptomyces sp. ATCC51928]MDX3592087.1 helix-turn-helix domain containing protein [Streptomyces sp. ID03-2B]MDX5520289.1 helix-turn-helix domain containing protein [Streptomyces sp. DE06-01C]
MHIQDTHGQAALSRASEDHGRLGSVGALGVMSSADAVRSAAAVSAAALSSAGAGQAPNGATTGAAGAPRSAPLRVDAQRNLEHVLRAAREVFGELGYGAPMEDVARRARVGVGTVYRRFPSKDVLVRRIAEEETSRLTEQARTALGQEEKPWSALSRFLRTSVASGAGRLLPPQVLRVGVDGEEPGAPAASGAASASGAVDETRVPQQRQGVGQDDFRVVGPRSGSGDELDGLGEDSGAVELLEVVGQLVDRARDSGELRRDVTVADVLLVIATAAPSLPDAAQQAAASARLLDILLEGLRSRPA